MKLLFSLLIMFVSQAAMAKQPLVQIGEATFSFLWMDVYTSKLLSSEKAYREDAFLRLENTYHMNFSAQELLESTREELQRVSDVDEATLDTWMQQLEGVYPDVKEGEVIAAESNQNSVKIFYKDTLRGTLNGGELSRAFMGIWLSEKSRSPTFSKELTGR